jgi:hypothetical protein
MIYHQRKAIAIVLLYLFVALLSSINASNAINTGNNFEEQEEDFYRSAHMNYDERYEKSVPVKNIVETIRGWIRKTQTTPVAQIVDLFLINTDTNEQVARLVDGLIVPIGTTVPTNFNILATVTTTGTIGSVRFGYNTTTNYQTENNAPYAFCGNPSPTTFHPCPELNAIGMHTVTATPYSGSKATGTVGAQKKVSFRIVKSWLTTPIVAPTATPKDPTRPPTKSPISKSPTKVPVPVPSCGIPKV